jgi:thiamine biosynthesis lipoprotein ApbE
MTRQEMVFNAAVRIYAAKDVNFDRAVRTAVKLWECSVEATDDDVEDALDESGTPTLTMDDRIERGWLLD